jgi:nucleolar protein 4
LIIAYQFFFFLGRQIAIDWAIPKQQYATLNNKTDEVPNIEPQEKKNDRKDEESDDEENNDEDNNDEEEQDGEASDSEVENGSGEEESPKKEEAWKGDNSEIEKKSDVAEGKTLFIRNLDFSTTKDSLKNFMEKFGSVHYALLCMDKIMERPKGTGFVKFRVSCIISKINTY